MVVERERKKGTLKCYEHYRRSLREGGNGRGGKGINLTVCHTVQELSSRLAWKQETTKEIVKR